MSATAGEEEKKSSSGTYECGCHCGYIKFSVTLSPPLPEYQVLQCNCSACTRFGYLLICKSLPCLMYTILVLLSQPPTYIPHDLPMYLPSCLSMCSSPM